MIEVFPEVIRNDFVTVALAKFVTIFFASTTFSDFYTIMEHNECSKQYIKIRTYCQGIK